MPKQLTVKEALRRSQYMWTLNCNVSYREELVDEEFSRKYRRTMEQICREMEFKLEEADFQQRKPKYKDVEVSVVSFEYNLERGEKNRALHAHGIVKFDNWCRPDETRLQSWIKSTLVRKGIRDPNRPHGVITSFHWFKDEAAVAKAYVRKNAAPNLEPDRSKLTIDHYSADDLRRLAKKHQIPGRWKAKKQELWDALQPYIG